jgi:hypothetical protein
MSSPLAHLRRGPFSFMGARLLLVRGDFMRGIVESGTPSQTVTEISVISWRNQPKRNAPTSMSAGCMTLIWHLAHPKCCGARHSQVAHRGRRLRCCTAPRYVTQFKFFKKVPFGRDVRRIKMRPKAALVTHTTGRAESIGYFRTQSCCVCSALHC